MIDRAEAEDILRDIGSRADSEIDLADAALVLASLDRSRVDLARYRNHLAELARDVGAALSAGRPLADALRETVAGRYDYHGDTLTYDDIQNANLIRVIDRRKGLPVALGILYLHAARAQGADAAGLNFPGHFLIRVDDDGNRRILDPFNDGMTRTAADLRDLLKATAGLDAELDPQHYDEVGNRDILIRLQNNIKTRHERAGRAEEALKIVDRMLLFAPERMGLWREAGVFNARLGNLAAAIEAFETIVEQADSDAARHDAAMIIQKLRHRLN